ncbi:hypothetical protein [Paraburkholderia sp. J94]|uniref:hypothetical protein n=1 Tax=Paraburkholderia sp. J94 TaxID=2805441 RepID=UPI002AB26902|nr:hypothetical protein [Paraburkholderia sp. J94]
MSSERAHANQPNARATRKQVKKAAKEAAKKAAKSAKIARIEKERRKTTRAIALNLRHAATQRKFCDTRSTD